MKKVTIISSFLMLLVAGVVMASAVAAAFRWVETEHNFGQIKQGKPVTAEFAFTNTGEAPLVISKAYGSCGCTGVDYPKEPIMPGAKGIIKATFNAAAKGAFNKTVTIESNAETGFTTLNIKGEVTE
ncbi:MAG: DUF1573 domain-containing protein [Spirosomaceae bacterium]|jgi:hypothetical protein|nr:DUF1573 domain-containing protein [Spirosomataceae bacterium]